MVILLSGEGQSKASRLLAHSPTRVRYLSLPHPHTGRRLHDILLRSSALGGRARGKLLFTFVRRNEQEVWKRHAVLPHVRVADEPSTPRFDHIDFCSKLVLAASVRRVPPARCAELPRLSPTCVPAVLERVHAHLPSRRGDIDRLRRGSSLGYVHIVVSMRCTASPTRGCSSSRHIQCPSTPLRNMRAAFVRAQFLGQS